MVNKPVRGGRWEELGGEGKNEGVPGQEGGGAGRPLGRVNSAGISMQQDPNSIPSSFSLSLLGSEPAKWLPQI